MLLDFTIGIALALTTPLGGQMTELQEVDYILPAQRVITYPPEGQLRMLSALPMPPETQTAFDNEFTVATFFAAFAVSKEGGYGYAVTANTLGAARDIALRECLAQNSNCIVIAEIVPFNYTPPGPGDVTLTPEVANYYINPGKVSGARAMAVSADGAYALVWGHASQPEADTAALSDCESYRIADLVGLMDMPCIILPGLP